eukprot:gene6741-10906_t
MTEQLGNETTSFPQEIIIDNILPFFQLKELPTLSLVNKEFSDSVDNDFTWKTVLKNQFLSKEEIQNFTGLEKGDTFKQLCKTKVQSEKKKTKSQNKFNRRAEKKKKEIEKKNEKVKKKIDRKKQERLEKKELAKMKKLHPERYIEKEEPSIYFDMGSGMGIYQRGADLSIEKISECKDELKIKKLSESSVNTPFGFDSFPLEIGNLKHLFKGPITDPNGHNCWLNSILVFILSNPTLVDQIMNDSNPNQLSTCLKNFFVHWIKNQHEKDFRKKFEYLYGKVWLNVQKLGFKYGTDYSIQITFSEISKVLNIQMETNDYLITNEKQNNENLELKSWINHEVLAYTKEGLPIGHGTCYSRNEHGTFYFDDILNVGDDFQGGLMKKEFDFEKSNVQLFCYSKMSLQKNTI